MNIQIVTRYFIRPELRELIHSKGLSIKGLRKPLKWSLSSLGGRFWGNATISKEQRDELGQLLSIFPEDMDKFFTPWDKLERHLTEAEWKDLEDYPQEWELEKLIHLKIKMGAIHGQHVMPGKSISASSMSRMEIWKNTRKNLLPCFGLIWIPMIIPMVMMIRQILTWVM